MPRSHRLLLAVSSVCLCLGLTSFGQTTESVHSKIRRSSSAGLVLKNLVERHFESTHPHARPDLGGAVPGRLLLEQHRLGINQGKLHSVQNHGLHPQAITSGSPLPGIALRPYLPAGSLPTTVATGDFNNDGHMDFAVANALTNDVWLYLGKGDGTFQNPRIVPLTKGLTPVSIAAADLRGNGKLDLILGEFDSSTVGVLLGNGDGTFGYETLYSVPSPVEAIVVDDFNHDGKPDVAALLVDGSANPTPEIALLTGDGTGSLSSPVLSYNSGYVSAAWIITSGDVNGDGLPDLLITGPGLSDNSTVFLNNGDGTFRQGQTAVYDMTGFETIILLDGRLADVNGDGCLDVVAADAMSAVWIALGDCSGNFAAPTFFMMGDSNAAVRVTDVNGDGIPDLVTSALPALNGALLGQVAGNTLSIALGTGKGNFSPPRNYVGTSQAYSIGIADFNGDGKPDFVTVNNDTDTVTVYQNDGDGGFGFPQGVYAGVTGQGVDDAPFSSPSFLDINNDGKTDVFLLDEGYNGEYYATSFLNDGTGKLSSPVLSDLGISINPNWIGDHRLGNFRDASHLDVVAIGLDQSSSLSVQFILFAPGNGDGTFGKRTFVTATGADGILTTGDFNHDGKLDFVAVNGLDTHTLTTFLGNGDGTFHSLTPITFTDPASDTFDTEPVRIYAGDFNRDGKLDVLVYTTGNGYGTTRSTAWEFDSNGDGTFQAGRQLFTDFLPFALADINGDGYPDIVRYDGVVPGIPRFTNFLDQPDGSFVQSSLYTPYTGVPMDIEPYFQDGDPLSSSLVTDLNGDGKPDEVALQTPAPGATPSYAQIMMGNGDGTFTPTYDIFPFYVDNQPLYAHDLDGDGVADMVSLIQATSSLQVFKGSRAPALQIELADSIVQNNASCGWVFPNVVSNSDQTVSLFSSVPGVVLPASVTIPSGALSAKFCYTLGTSYDWHRIFDVNAQLDGDTATAYASSSYVVGFSESFSSPATSTIYPGQSVGPISITLTPAPGYASTVHLSCEDLAPGDSCQFGSDTLNLSASGPVSTTVTLITGPNSGTYGLSPTFTIVANDGNVLKRQALTVQLVGLNVFPLGPGTAEMLSPGSSSMQLEVTGIPPFTFSCLGLPAGASCTVSDPVSNISNLTLSVPSGISAGNYPIQINVTSETFQASTLITLGVISVAAQPSSPSDQWSIPGSSKQLSITVQGSANVPSTYVQVACSLDVVGSTCASDSVSLSPGSPTANALVNLTLPANAGDGPHQLSVTWSFPGFAQTSTFPFTVADFSGSLSASTIRLASGGSGTVTATLNATAGFTGQISFSCSGSGIACSFSPKTAQLTAGTAQTDTITLTAPAIAANRAPWVPSSSDPLVLALVLPIFFARGTRRRRLLLWIGALLMVTGISACGGGGTGGSGSGGGGGSTNYSITISAIESTTGASRTLGTVAVTVTH